MQKNGNTPKGVPVGQNGGRRDFMRNSLLGITAVAGVTTLSNTAAAQDKVSVGPSRKVIWVTHHLGEWNLYLDTAFLDFCDQYGWSYQKVGVAEGGYSVDQQVNLIRQAIQAHPDAIVTTMVDRALEPALKEIEDAGITLMINNACFEDIRQAHGWGFVGAPPYQQGLVAGRMMVERLIAGGRTEGVILAGNSIPGHVQLEERGRGIVDGVAEASKAKNAKFKTDYFADQATDLAQSIPLYNAKRASLGSSLAAIVTTGYNSAAAAYMALQQEGVEPGKIPISGMDTTPDMIAGIEAGYISFVIEQELYHQGFMAAAALWARIERGATQPVIDTSSAFVTIDNVARFKSRSNIVLARAKELGLRH